MSVSESNPYAPPASSIIAGDSLLVGDVFRDGTFLIVRDGAELPAACLRTNQTGESGFWRKRVTITWGPPWVYALILLHPVVLLLAMVLAHKRAKITYSLSPQERGKIVAKRGFAAALMGVAVVLFVVGYHSSPVMPMPVLVGWVAALVASLAMVVIANPVKAVRHRDGWFRVKGCSPDFLATLPQAPVSAQPW